MRPAAWLDYPPGILRRPGAQAVLLLSAWFALVAAITGAWRNVPVIDDWTYAWTVEHLLSTGRFDVLDWSSAYPLSQALWGAAWSTVLGFSFASLRISTLVLALVGCGALYLILRELGASPRVALLGALTVAVNPIFVFLSSSFMTDVPFTTFTMLALLGYVRAASRGDARLLWWAGAWTYAAFLVRQVGIAIPVAGLPLLLVPSNRAKMARGRIVAALATTWLAMAVTLFALRATLGTTSVMEKWSWNLYARPSSYFEMNLPLLSSISFYLLPLLLALAVARRIWRRPLTVAASGMATATLLFLALGEIPTPLSPESTWTVQELGSSRLLINGTLPPPDAVWLDRGVRLVSWTAMTLLMFFTVTGLGRLVTAWRTHRPAMTRKTIDWASARAPLAMFLAAYIALVNLLWMYLDRYVLPMVPVIIALLLGVRQPRVAAPRVAVGALGVFAVIALLGTRDALRYNQAVRDTWQSLVDAGVPATDIDAGYAWNGWMLYAHPANLAPGQTPLRDVPWVTSDRKAAYLVSKSPVDGYAVMREVRWHELPWPAPDRLLVLKHIVAAGADVVASQ